jgi:hypothetical protein
VASGGFINTSAVVIEKARPFLEPGEVVAHVVKAVEGPSRWIAILLGFVIGIGLSVLIGAPLLGVPLFALVYTSAYQRRIILATDEALVLLAGGRYRFTPKKVLARLDLETRIGPLQGMFLKTELDGRRLYVTSRSAGEVAAADADIDDSAG